MNSISLGYPGLRHDSHVARYSPDRSMVASAGSWSTTGGCPELLRVWSWPEGRLLHGVVHQGTLCCLSWAPDSKSVVVAGYNSELYRLDLDSGELIGRVAWRGGPPSGALCHSLDGALLAFATCHSKRTVLLLDSETLETVRKLQLPEWVDGARQLAFVEGALLAEHDDQVFRLELDSGACSSSDATLDGRADFLPHEERVIPVSGDPHAEQRYPEGVSGLAWSADGTRLAWADRSGWLRVVDGESGATVAESERAGGGSVVAAPDGSWLASDAKGWAVLDSASLAVTRAVRAKGVQGLKIAPDGHAVLGELPDTSVKVWSYPKLAPLHRVKHSFCGHFTGDSSHVVLRSFRSELTWLRLDDGEVGTLKPTGDSIAPHAEGVVLGSLRGIQRLRVPSMKASRRQAVDKRRGYFPPSQAIASAAGGRVVALGVGDLPVVFEGKQRTLLPAMERHITALALSPDGARLAVGAGSDLRIVHV